MTESPNRHSLRSDLDWTFESVESVSRTFALSIELLEKPVNSWICTGYLLCRAADTIEDESSISPVARAELLELYDRVIDSEQPDDISDFMREVAKNRPETVSTDWEVLEETDRVFRILKTFSDDVQKAIRTVVREMSVGMAKFLRRYAHHGGLRIQTIDELEEYCWYVAGTVGELFTSLLSCYDADKRSEPDTADVRSFALLLQLINIAKDVPVDLRTENNVYLPAEWLADEGIGHDAIENSTKGDAVAAVIRRVVKHAESYTDGARRALATLPENQAGMLEATTLPYLLALGTARELHARTDEAVESAVKLERTEVAAIYGEMRQGITHNDIDPMSEAVRTGQYTQ